MQIRCCKNCVAPKRHLGCHIDCEEYLKEKAENEEISLKIKQERILDQLEIYRSRNKSERRK